MKDMHPQDFLLFADVLKRSSGLVVTEDKTYLLESRLLPVAHSYGLQNLAALAHSLRAGKEPQLQQAVVEAMATSETSFFRDFTPFERLRDTVLPALMTARAKERRLRIWSAACASGQEPYSIAMLLHDMPELRGWDCEVLATDMSRDILARAKAGAYTQFEVQRGLPARQLVSHFTQEGGRWVLSPVIRNYVRFMPHNLLADAPPGLFDVIFCRNVLFYFDVDDKARVLETLSRGLMDDGTLFLGGTETVLGASEDFAPLEGIAGIFTKRAHEKSGRFHATAFSGRNP